MIIPPGDSNAASFNDDSSPDSRLTSNTRVSVNAQVIPESSLDWYYRILQLCPSVSGELKSADVWPRFQLTQGENKDRIWAGLSKVRIHIVDPRPYRKSVDNMLKAILRVDDPGSFLQGQVAAKKPYAIWLSLQSHVVVAERIVDDSVGARVHSVSRYLSEMGSAIGMDDSKAGQSVLHLSEFGNDVKPLVRKATAWAAKSAATFHEALDCFQEFEEEMIYFPHDIVRRRMKARVLDTHAFDKGDQKQLELLEKARGNILENLSEPVFPGSPPHPGPAQRPYTQADSKDSYLVQAADIAAGIASKLLETQNLVTVVTSFEYVTYNGQRLSVSDAEEVVRLSRD